jgi:GTP cyclohydrolase I
MKTDKELGLKVNQFLKEKGVETPFRDDKKQSCEAYKNIADSFTEIMKNLGLDLTDDSLKDTPKRVAKMYLYELFTGLDYENFPKCTTVENKMRYDEMVSVSDISVLSNCEHHFVTIDGTAKVSYIPKDKVLGLSKINRIVDFFCKRPQIQERLTEQVYWALVYILGTEDIAVKINAVHYCVKSRGVKDVNSKTTTTKLGGGFKLPEVRNEFLNS